MTFFTLACHAQITEVDNMEEVFQFFKDADSNTLAIFDVDMVLVQPKDPAFQMANMKRYSRICKRIMKEIPPDMQMISEKEFEARWQELALEAKQLN